MPLPLSKKQVRRLGERLRDAVIPSTEDLDLLNEVLVAYDEALTTAGDILWQADLTASGRLKNTGTIIEKLRRESGANLPNVQDVAGLRVVLADGEGRRAQDEAVEAVVGLFASETRPPRVYDRRARPSRGYRAVHVVVEVDGLPVEIQIRTSWQQEWAEFFEKLADRLGRDIRYGGGRPDLGLLLPNAQPDYLSEFEQHMVEFATQQVEVAVELADLISRVESLSENGGPNAEIIALEDDLRRLMTSTSREIDRLLHDLGRLT